MLHEILLSLSGHPSPLLRTEPSASAPRPVLSTPERDLLKTAGHLSELHCRLIKYTAHVNAAHPSAICRAVSNAIVSVHLAAFQNRVIEVEEGILRKDASLVGAYDIVPLTAAVGAFSEWTHRLEWLWGLVQHMLQEDQGTACRGAQLIDKLRREIQTGYVDIGALALQLTEVAEAAWLKQVSAWILYGRIPSFGADDFFIQADEQSEHGYRSEATLLPSFVHPSTVSSMLFIGTSLNRVRTGTAVSKLGDLGHLSSQLQELASLTFPLNTAAFARTITSVRLHLSRTVLQKLLPLSKVVEMLRVLREFFLLGRGEFAMALTQQADEKLRNRWRRADNLDYEKRDGLGTAIVKEGEVAAVLSRTWAVLGSMQSEHADEDEGLEAARELIRLHLSKTLTATPGNAKSVASNDILGSLVATPFSNLLFSIPVTMSLQINPPLDLFLGSTEVAIYSSVNAYLLSVRRAHLRLTDLWKITSLRRQHPPPPRAPFSTTRAGMAQTRTLRERWSGRSLTMRSIWTTSSAAIFFLAETEAYLQVEVVEGLWDDFHQWLSGANESTGPGSRPSTSRQVRPFEASEQFGEHSDDAWIQAGRGPTAGFKQPPVRDPQTLSIAHRLYLTFLTRRLLLTRAAFTGPLYHLLVHIDRLVALIHRLHGIWTSMDLEADEGVVDAFSNLGAEEIEVKLKIKELEVNVKRGVEDVVGVLRVLSVDPGFMAELEGESELYGDDEGLIVGGEEGMYAPKRIGGIDRLLMKLDFGGWFDQAEQGSATGDEQSS